MKLETQKLMPAHPLRGRGFRSIGGMPRTRAVALGKGLRAGRWPRLPDKVDCGIHFSPDDRIIRSKRGDDTA